MTQASSDPLPPALFERLDTSPDPLFYQSPRFVAHIDDKTIEALTSYYQEILFEQADVLDLMSSWISHLPTGLKLGRIVGVGMNDLELQANPRLSDYVVQDLNAHPTLPYETDSFDFVFIAVSIQYLIKPVEVFTDIARVLRSSGRVVVATSHRCFPTKAIRGFQKSSIEERLQLIGEYMRRTTAFDEPVIVDRSPQGADPLWLVTGAKR
ncbi:MAG: SAM-dependent methyltransferase [Gammaproteobacteria bacterium]|jgi:SAM-dependent methyltransferase